MWFWRRRKEMTEARVIRAVLEELGVTNFVDRLTARHSDGSELTVMLSRQPEYVVGLKLARKHRRNPVMDHDAYKRLAESSAELDAASQALNEGADLAGATVATSLIAHPKI